MEQSTSHVNTSPVTTANFLSRLFFCWLNPLMWKGYKSQLEDTDLYNAVDQDKTERLCNKLQREWEKELEKLKQGKQPSLRYAIARAFGRRLMLMGGFVLFEEATKLVQPLLLAGLIRYFDNSGSVTTLDAYMYALGLSLCVAVLATMHHPYFYNVQRIGMAVRIATSALIYKKALKLGHNAFKHTTVGQIVNLLTNDVTRFDLALLFIHFLWVGPIQCIAVLVLLWKWLGPASLAGFVVIVLLMPLQSSMGRLFSKLRVAVAKQTDERVKIVNEILTGIRVIKMYCWEKMFSKLYNTIRGREMHHVIRTAYVKALVQAPFFNSNQLIVYSLVLCFIKSSVDNDGGASLNAETIFMTMALINPLRLVCTLFVPYAFQFGSEAFVTVARIQNFLLLEELADSSSITYTTIMQPNDSSALHGEDNCSDALRKNNSASSMSDKVATTAKITALNMKAAWQPDQSATFEGVSFDLSSGQLMTVIGPIGAGKSSLLLALLSELPLSAGSGKISGTVAYTAQQPWVFSASVRQNILFGRDYDAVLYERVVRAAALKQDFDQLSHGDQTLVGERGVSLSGGQKARIGLARSLYVDADIYLLDDPLSAVDPAVSRHLFDQCICGFLKNKIRILVTHQIQYIERADKILVLNEGKVQSLGTYEELSKSGVDFDAVVHQHASSPPRTTQGSLDHTDSTTSPLVPLSTTSFVNGGTKLDGENIASNLSQSYTLSSVLIDDIREDAKLNTGINNSRKLAQSLKNLHHHHPYATGSDKNPLLMQVLRKRRQSRSESNLPHVSATSLVQLDSIQNTLQSVCSLDSLDHEIEPEPAAQRQADEQRKQGTIGALVYAKYFWAGGGTLGVVLLVLLNLAAHAAYVITDWWLSYWTEQEHQARNSALLGSFDNSTGTQTPATFQSYTPVTSGATPVSAEGVPVYKYLYVYTGLVVGVFLLGLLRALLMFRLMVQSSKRMHNAMFTAVIRSPVLFFDTNPIGRILNRFSKDTGLMDEMLPITMYDFLLCAQLVIGTVLLTGFINPWVFIPTVPLVIVFLLVRKVFLETSRDIKRIEATARSPVFSHLSTSLHGLHTIRSLQAQSSFIRDFYAYQDLHTEAWSMFLAVNRWFAVRLDWLCVVFITVVAFLSIAASDSLSGGLVGLTMVYAINLMGLFQWAVRQSAEVENQMVSVERILEYSKLPNEGELDGDPNDDLVTSTWPTQGRITAEHAAFRYSGELPQVLNDVCFDIRPKEKIGIVGRTGAGKSSMVAMLFRLAKPSGLIQIDDVDVSRLGLHQLRGAMSIIPQDPVLFGGTVRTNLDPFDQYTDTDIWNALDEVEMKSVISETPGGLEAHISEGGGNYSVGQRQLLCLCRAVLRRNKILVIDEATANVDPRTDSLIQKTLRSTFRDCTVLTIAHRINTIVDSHRIMVLDNGHIVEFDAPYVLLQNDDSKFSAMLKETGKTHSKQLLEIARQSYIKHHNDDASQHHNSDTASQHDITASQDTPVRVNGRATDVYIDNQQDKDGSNEQKAKLV